MLGLVGGTVRDITSAAIIFADIADFLLLSWTCAGSVGYFYLNSCNLHVVLFSNTYHIVMLNILRIFKNMQ